MSDPLSLLRKYTIEKKKVKMVGEFIMLGPHKFRRETKTAYRSKPSKRGGKEKRAENVMLNAIVFLLQNQKLKPADYVTACVKQGIKNIHVGERNMLLKYMKGEIKELPSANLDRKLLRLQEQQLPKGDATEYKDPQSWKIEDIFAQEKIPRQDSFLKNTTKNFTYLMETFATAQKRPPQLMLAQLEKAAVEEEEKRRTKRRKNKRYKAEDSKAQTSQVPIIVVPSAMTSLITMYNAEAFLGGGLFRTSNEMRGKSNTKAERIIITRKSYMNPDKNCQFEVIDNVKHISQGDWPRVVAIFVNGARWQFTGWPWGGIPAKVFHHALGFHMFFEDEPINKNILTWKVTLMPINKLKRYRDRGIVLEFWKHVCMKLAVKCGGIGQAKLTF